MLIKRRSMFKEMDKIKDKFFKEADEFIAKMKELPKCELCDYDYTDWSRNNAIKKRALAKES
jgi:hypothetical protein